MHAIGYDAVRDEIVVPQQFGQAVLVFRGGASGEEPPARTIRGPKTMLIAPDRLAVDSKSGEIFVPEGDKLLVFPAKANGDVAPVRVITGFVTVRAVAVDTVRDLLVTTGSSGGGGRSTQIMIFPRTANGDVKPLRVITGLGGAQNVTVDPEHGLIFVVQLGNNTGYVGVWSIDDTGRVPPRFTIGGPNGTLFDPRGVVIDAKNNAVIVSDKQLNAALTYHVPQVFATPSQAQAGR